MSQPLPFTSGLLSREHFSQLLTTVQDHCYRVLGPILRDGAIVWDTISELKDLPQGWRDQQQPGHYPLEHTNTARYFDIVLGPESLKRQNFAPR